MTKIRPLSMDPTLPSCKQRSILKIFLHFLMSVHLHRVVLSSLGLLVVMATVHDAWRMILNEPFDSKKDGHVINVLHCFSALTNGRRLLSMKSTKSPSNLACVHGIRVLSTCWVVIGHSWIIGPASNSMNPSMVNDVSI